jgi:hypothetical protein
MVDALRRARRWVRRPSGWVIDLRPAHVVAHVELGLPDGEIIAIGGLEVEDERRLRHLAADAAVRAVCGDGSFGIESELEFPFFRYPSSLDELREYIATKWQHTRLSDATYARGIAQQREHRDGRIWLREQVSIRILRPYSRHG